MNDRLWVFSGTQKGEFVIDEIMPIVGEALPAAPCLTVAQQRPVTQAQFSLEGIVSNERYTTRMEKQTLTAHQRVVGGAKSNIGALIPIKKSQAWWALTQDERRAIFEDRSQHIKIGMQALPQVARRLHHCRDLERVAPFDFLTWFDFAEEDRAKFDDLVGMLRATEEWQFVEREVEIRVHRFETVG